MFKSLSLFVIALFAWVSCVATANEQIRIRDIFEFDEDISVEIHSVSHQIVHYGRGGPKPDPWHDEDETVHGMTDGRLKTVSIDASRRRTCHHAPDFRNVHAL